MDTNNQIAAVFTLVNNQPEFQEIWIKYYSQFPFKLVILEHVFNEEEDGWKDTFAVGEAILEHRKIFKAEIFDHPWMCSLTEGVQRELLENHETVFYTDIDELIVPVNGTLEQYVRENKESIIRCQGYHIVERKYIVHDSLFDKPALTRTPVNWKAGWHSCKQGGKKDSSLWLVHLHRMDYEIARKHWFARKKAKWDHDAIARRQSWQNSIPTEEEFREWFHTEKKRHTRQDVPEWLVEKLRGFVF